MGQGVEMMCRRVSDIKVLAGLQSFFMVYSPECVEVEFSEVRMQNTV
jgi:hypothetical protein